MKKAIVIILFALLTINTNAQEKFTYSEKGLTDYVVLKIDSLNQSKLYNKTIDWVKENYINPDEVIKAKFENEKIRFNGFKENAFLMTILATPMYLDGRYTIEISFKDGKLKFDPLSLEQYSAPSQYSAGGWSLVTLETNSWLFKKNGKIRSVTETYPENIEGIFNNLILSLNVYLLKESGVINDSEKDW
jgi:hypothetical protein